MNDFTHLLSIDLEHNLFELLLQLLHMSLRDAPSFSNFQAMKDITDYVIVPFIFLKRNT